MIDFKKQIARELNDPTFGLTDEDVEGMIEIPADTSHGDYAFPCFKLARTMRKAPPLIAADVAERIAGSPFFEKVEQVNAYVNMFLSREQVAGQVVSEVLKEKDDFGRSDVGHGKTVIVEYSSPNIAKPFHIGHIRSTVIGNAIYKLYDETGYNVVRINHLGDYGTQFGKMIVAYRMWGNHDELAKDPIKTLLGYYTRFHKEAEKDPTLDEKAREAFAKLEAGNEEEVQLWKKFRELSLKEFNRVYDMLGITFDSYAGESFYSDKMPAVIEELKEKGLLQESRGAQIVDLESMGISTPAVIQKSDGSSLYATRDIAAAIYRKQTYDFYKCIYVVASQQNLHFQQWKAVLQLMGYDWQKDCVHVPFGLVSLPEGTMSTRNGRVVFLEDVLKTAVEKTREIIAENTEGIDVDEVARQVGIGAVIFQELSNNRIKDYVFDWNNVTNFDGETGPYVQYTHARACSVLRKAGEADLEKMRSGGAADYGYLTSESAYQLVKDLSRVPEVIRDAAEKYEPSILTRHLVDVAQSFNKFYHDEHILVDNEDEKLAKLALVDASRIVIKNCLGLLGIEAPERM